MSRRNRRLLVPEAREAVNQLKVNVMSQEGIRAKKPEDVKYEVANEVGVPLKEGYNGNLTSTQAGKVGGKIGGSMVREMIKLAQESLEKKHE